MSWWSRLGNVFRSDRLSRDLDEELQLHLEARAQELIDQGLTPEAAAREARRRVGNPLRLREESRDVKLLPWLDSLVRDIRLGARMLRKSPMVMTAAIASLALALGACLTAVSLVDALILRPLPVANPDELVSLSFPTYNAERPESDTFNDPMYVRLRDEGRDQVDLFAVSTQVMNPVILEAGGAKEHVRMQFVAGTAFRLLGISARTGRAIGPADDDPAAAPVAMLSHAFWQRRFGGDPDMVGRAITYQGRSIVIVGVAEPRFTGVEPGRPTDLWLPYGAYNPRAFGSPNFNWFRILGRIRNHASPAAVHDVLQATFTNFRREYVDQIGPSKPDEVAQFLAAPIHVRSAASGVSPLRRQFARALWILAAIAGVVLLIAGSNLANLYLARGAGRDREMALRLSIGAGRGRLIQQLLIESAIVAAGACFLGLLLAASAAPAVVRMLASPDDPVQLDLRMNGTLVAVAALLTLGVAALFGLVPAWRASRVSPITALNAGGPRSAARTGVLRPFVALQVAFGLVVLFVGGLLVMSFARLSRVDPGFATSDIVLADVEPTQTIDGPQRRAMLMALLEQLRAEPGVRSGSLAEFNPIGRAWTREFTVPGSQSDIVETTMQPVADGYFETMSIPILAGRPFTAADMTPPRSAVIVNDAFVRRYFGRKAAVGGILRGRFQDDDARTAEHEIVGVVADARYDVRQAAAPILYVPFRTSGTFLLRVAGDTAAFGVRLRERVRAAAPTLRVTTITTQSTVVRQTLLRERLLAAVSSLFAVIGLVLVGVGLYGVLSYSVLARTREIGIRMALGASQRSVITGILKDVGVAVAGGAVAGLICGAYASRFVESLLFEVRASEAVSTALPLGVFLFAALTAAALPAWRATRIEPVIALRRE